MAVHLGLPPRSLFRFPPADPPALPAPAAAAHSWLQPFNIPQRLYTALLSPKVPITIALTYATVVVLVNRINRKRGYRPWPISRTRAFRFFVILHNLALALYSAWTFAGMVHALRSSSPVGHGGRYGLVNVVDALCKINGPRGLGNAARFDTNSKQWQLQNPQHHLDANGLPDSTDVGRLWNGGLAYFGFLFYLSKFYEVVDTAIILAKGKRSSTLQTYHHAGAMMCMWAGIRYMAAPIWIFALFNSLIHSFMYTYYALTALAVRIPTRIKKSLTTLQIAQFIIGTLLAGVHLFVYYTIPVKVSHPVTFRPSVESVAQRSNVSSSLFSSSPSSTTTTITNGAIAWLKKLAFRAAGAQGVAANVLSSNGTYFGSDGAGTAKAVMDHREVREAVEPHTVTCMDTSGQAFAVWLNLVYLLPLTFLFVRFFVRSYLRRPAAAPVVHRAEKAGMDAIKGVTREITNAVMEMHGDGLRGEGVVSGTTTPRPERSSDDDTTDAAESRARKQHERTEKSMKTERAKNAEESAKMDRIGKTEKSGITGTSADEDESEDDDEDVDEAAYEASLEDIMSGQEKRIESHPEESTATSTTTTTTGLPPRKRKTKKHH